MKGDEVNSEILEPRERIGIKDKDCPFTFTRSELAQTGGRKAGLSFAYALC
jgi:hypothetical protein